MVRKAQQEPMEPTEQMVLLERMVHKALQVLLVLLDQLD
jgi:hypothetical protein